MSHPQAFKTEFTGSGKQTEIQSWFRVQPG